MADLIKKSLWKRNASKKEKGGGGEGRLMRTLIDLDA